MAQSNMRSLANECIPYVGVGTVVRRADVCVPDCAVWTMRLDLFLRIAQHLLALFPAIHYGLPFVSGILWHVRCNGKTKLCLIGGGTGRFSLLPPSLSLSIWKVLERSFSSLYVVISRDIFPLVTFNLFRRTNVIRLSREERESKGSGDVFFFGRCANGEWQ